MYVSMKMYSETCILIIKTAFVTINVRSLSAGGLYIQVHLKHDITVCSENGGLKIQVVFLDSGHIIQVPLFQCYVFIVN